MSSSPSDQRQSTPPACLWKENPYRLVSLWDMQFHATKAMTALELIAGLEMASILGRGQIQSPTLIELHSQKFDELEAELRQLELKRQADKIADMAKFMRSHNTLPDVTGMTSLSLLIHHDLDEFVFEAVPRARAGFYESRELFGDAVRDKFSTTVYDVRESGNCYALGRNTACVFHLMRVLEIGLSVLAKQFNIPSGHTNWETIINQIEKAIRDMDKDPQRPSNWKDEREFYNQCASHFRVVKDAWRNYTAHTRGKYEPGEAFDILVSVRSFMQKLSTRLQEELP